jgi:hypothetical protein
VKISSICHHTSSFWISRLESSDWCHACAYSCSMDLQVMGFSKHKIVMLNDGVSWRFQNRTFGKCICTSGDAFIVKNVGIYRVKRHQE